MNATENESGVTLVIPALNEALSLPELMEEAAGVLRGLHWNAVIVDDGSSDDTWKVIAELAGRLPVTGLRFGRNQGKAAALAAGIALADREWVATLDADLQDDPAEIPGMIRYARENGLQLVSGWKKVRHDPAEKTMPSRLFNWAVRRSTGIGLHDFNCGLKVYRRDAARSLDLYGEMHRYTPVLAAMNGFMVGEVPVHHRPRRLGRSKYGWSRYFRGFSDLLTVLFLNRYSFRPLHFFGGIGVVLTTAGFIINAYLSVLWFSGIAIGNRPLLLLGVLLMLGGFQFVSMGLLGEIILRFGKGRPANPVERTP